MIQLIFKVTFNAKYMMARYVTHNLYFSFYQHIMHVVLLSISQILYFSLPRNEFETGFSYIGIPNDEYSKNRHSNEFFFFF